MTSGEDVVRLSSIDMSIADEFDGLFAGKIPAVKDLNGIFVRNYNTFFINNGVAYKANSGGLQLTPMAMKNDDYYAVAGNTTWQVNSLFTMVCIVGLFSPKCGVLKLIRLLIRLHILILATWERI